MARAVLSARIEFGASSYMGTDFVSRKLAAGQKMFRLDYLRLCESNVVQLTLFIACHEGVSKAFSSCDGCRDTAIMALSQSRAQRRLPSVAAAALFVFAAFGSSKHVVSEVRECV